MSLGEIMVVLALACAAGLAVRTLWRGRKTGRHCCGDCSQCGGCHK